MRTMNGVHLAAVDLNLLVVLRELLRVKNTTLAAQRLGRTQSAVSHSLTRLRTLFEDPLFIRVGGGLRATVLAESLEPDLHDVLERANALVRRQPSEFDPSRLARTFAIGGTDYAEALYLPRMLARLRAEAPGVDVVTSFLGDDIERAIQAREVDLALGTRFRSVSALREEFIAEQDMRVCVRRGHPASRGRLSAKRFASYDHALVTPRNQPGGVVDQALELLGLRRRVVLRLPHFIAAALVVASSDLVVTLPRAFAEHMKTIVPISILPVPLTIIPFRFSVGFSAATEADPAHQWFRGLFVQVMREAFEKPVRPRPVDAGHL